MDSKALRQSQGFLHLLLASSTVMLLALPGLTASASASPVKTLEQGQTGRIDFETVNLTDKQFLTGAKEGEPVVISGELRLPDAGTGQLPAVVIVHGSAGVGAREKRWAEEINGLGVAAFLVDSFTGRGITRTVTDQSQIGLFGMIIDAYRALELLSTHPRLDPTRIALMGFSKGGRVVFNSIVTRFREMHGPDGVEFAAYLAFYPWCNITFIDGDQIGDRPIRIFHGTADDWTPIGPCREYVDRVRRTGKDIQLIEYTDAFHAFDNPRLPPSASVRGAINPSQCFYNERPRGQLVEKESGKPFSWKNPCMYRGATVGYNSRAHTQAIKDVQALLTATFNLSQ